MDVILLPCQVQIVARNQNILYLVEQKLEPVVRKLDCEPLDQIIGHNDFGVGKKHHVQVDDQTQTDTPVAVDEAQSQKTEFSLEVQRRDHRHKPRAAVQVQKVHGDQCALDFVSSFRILLSALVCAGWLIPDLDGDRHAAEGETQENVERANGVEAGLVLEPEVAVGLHFVVRPMLLAG